MELLKLAIEDFDSFYSLIEESFIEEERRDYSDALSLFREGKYEILKIVSDSKTVGFISLWHFPDFVFAEHFVTYKRYRNLGFGAEALSILKERLGRIILEAEPATSDLTKRRLSFYKRNGFLENPEDYTQPAYRKGASGVKLVIMSYPERLEGFEDTVTKIKRKVYSAF